MTRFTFRDLFWLVLVIALAIGWTVDRGRLATRLDALSHAAPPIDWQTATPSGPIIQEEEAFLVGPPP